MNSFCANTKVNLIMLVITGLAFYSLIFINFALHLINIKWHVLNNPFFLIIAINLINLFSNLKINSNLINTISALSLFVYIMHDNILFREFLRSDIVSKILIETGTSMVPAKMLLFALTLLILCTAISYIYCVITDKYIDRLSLEIKNFIRL